jgi:hypothetical protein
MSETYTADELRKIVRSIKRLQKSIEADREIKALIEQMDQIGTDGVAPKLEITLSELLGQS